MTIFDSPATIVDVALKDLDRIGKFIGAEQKPRYLTSGPLTVLSISVDVKQGFDKFKCQYLVMQQQLKEWRAKNPKCRFFLEWQTYRCDDWNDTIILHVRSFDDAKTHTLCFIDLDGVLVDFVGGVFLFHGFSIPWAEIGWEFDKKSGKSPEDFWGPLGQTFWSSLTKTEECDTIIAAAEKKFDKDNVFLCSSPCGTLGCAAGKAVWVDNNLPGYSRRLILSNRKEVFSGLGRVLIDDRDENAEGWEKLGGTSILVPRPWNKTHESRVNVAEDVVKAIEAV